MHPTRHYCTRNAFSCQFSSGSIACSQCLHDSMAARGDGKVSTACADEQMHGCTMCISVTSLLDLCAEQYFMCHTLLHSGRVVACPHVSDSASNHGADVTLTGNQSNVFCQHAMGSQSHVRPLAGKTLAVVRVAILSTAPQ